MRGARDWFNLRRHSARCNDENIRRDCLSKEDETQLVERVVTNVDRTFLWVSLVLDALENSFERSQGAIQNLISTLPKSVEGVTLARNYH
jgi:hypothetical protein